MRKSATTVVSGITAQVRRVITRSKGLGTGYYWVQVLGDHTKLMGDHSTGRVLRMITQLLGDSKGCLISGLTTVAHLDQVFISVSD